MSKLYHFCKHYPNGGAARNSACRLVIEFERFKGGPLPCSLNAGETYRGECDKAEFPTPEEIATDEAESEARFQKIGQARTAIVANLGGPWTRKNPTGGIGRIDCPACGGNGTLAYKRAAYNGHIHAACSTEGCVRWME